MEQQGTKSNISLFAAPLFYWRGCFHFKLTPQNPFSPFENCLTSAVFTWIAIRKSLSRSVASKIQKVWNSSQNSSPNQQPAIPHPAWLTKTFCLTARVNAFTLALCYSLDILGFILCDHKPLQVVACLQVGGGCGVQRQAALGGSSPHLLHRRQRVPRHAAQ